MKKLSLMFTLSVMLLSVSALQAAPLDTDIYHVDPAQSNRHRVAPYGQQMAA